MVARAREVRAELIEHLADVRRSKNLSQHDVCRATGIRQSGISAMERIERAPLLDTVIAYAGSIGREIVACEAHHFPLLELTAAEMQAVIMAVVAYADSASVTTPELRSAVARISKDLVDEE